MTTIIRSPKKNQTQDKTTDSFSSFFHTASNKEKTAVFLKAVKKANKDQRDLVINADLKAKLKKV